MDAPHVPKELARLITRERATLQALDSFVASGPTRKVRAVLSQLRADHAHRLSRLDVILGSIEGAPREPSEEFGDLVTEELELVGAALSVASYLKRLLLVERANAAEYEVAQLTSLPEGAHAIVGRAHEQERLHIAKIEELAEAVASAEAAPAGPRTRGSFPGAVPSHLPQSPTHRQLERDIREDFPSAPPGFRK